MSQALVEDLTECTSANTATTPTTPATTGLSALSQEDLLALFKLRKTVSSLALRKHKRPALYRALSYRGIAEQAGLDHSHVYSIFNGDRRPSFEVLFRLADAMKCPVSVMAYFVRQRSRERERAA